MNACKICKKPTHLPVYCGLCKGIIDKGKKRKIKKDICEQALINAWDGNAFRCYYSNTPLETTNSKNPRYRTFDHRTPRDKQDIVLAASLINDMKSDMTEQEFKKIIIELAKRFQGGHFDDKALDLLYYKR